MEEKLITLSFGFAIRTVVEQTEHFLWLLTLEK